MKINVQSRLESRSNEQRRGGALVLVAFATASLAVLSLSLAAMSLSSSNEQRAVHERMSALLVAEAGMGDAFSALSAGGTGDLGNAHQPVTYGGGSYWVSRTTNADGTISLVSTGSDDQESSRVELVLAKINTSIYRWGAFGELGVTLDSNAKVDSYNSTIGTYASQAVNGMGSNSYALTHGNVGSNANIMVKQNAMVKGSAVPGPGGTAHVVGNATISGATTPAAAPQALPPITVPTIATSGPLAVAQGVTANLGSGSYHWSSAGLGKNSTLNITGPATLVCDSLRLLANSKIVINASAGPVQIYVINDFVMSSNTHIYPTSYNPADVTVNLQSDNIIDPDMIVDLDQIDFQSNSDLIGTIYAPHAKISINSNFELYGAIIARDLLLDSWSRVHFDEFLLNSNANAQVTYSRVSFRVLAAP